MRSRSKIRQDKPFSELLAERLFELLNFLRKLDSQNLSRGVQQALECSSGTASWRTLEEESPVPLVVLYDPAGVHGVGEHDDDEDRAEAHRGAVVEDLGADAFVGLSLSVLCHVELVLLLER